MVAYVYPEVAHSRAMAAVIGVLLGLLLVLIDVLLKGFSLRSLSALTFGLLIGLLAAHFIVISPLFEYGDPQIKYVSQLAVYISVTYLATVLALRGKDEFNLVIPYVRFEPRNVETSLVVIDATALVDGRVTKLCKARLLPEVVTIPKFVVDELHELTSAESVEDRNRGKRALKTLSELRQLEHVEVRIYDSEVDRKQNRDEKIIFVVSSLKGRLLSTSETLIQKAKLEGVAYVDMLSLTKTLSHEVVVGETLTIRLVKMGKEDGQAVGYLEDGSMVVVNDGVNYIGNNVVVEVESIIPTSGGRMVFCKLLGEDI